MAHPDLSAEQRRWFDLAVTGRKLVYSIIDTCTRTRAEVGCLRKA